MDVAIVDLFSVTLLVSVGEQTLVAAGIQSQIKEALTISIKKCGFRFLLYEYLTSLHDFAMDGFDFYFIFFSNIATSRLTYNSPICVYPVQICRTYFETYDSNLNIFGLPFAPSVTSPLSVLITGFIKVNTPLWLSMSTQNS